MNLGAVGCSVHQKYRTKFTNIDVLEREKNVQDPYLLMLFLGQVGSWAISKMWLLYTSAYTMNRN
jgi:hypothetical protein